VSDQAQHPEEQSPPTPRAPRGRYRRRRLIAGGVAVLAATAGVAVVMSALASTGSTFVGGVTFPFNGAVIQAADGSHYWDASGDGICRVDVVAGVPTQVAATCDVQAKKPTQIAVGPVNPVGSPDAGMRYIYSADMSSKSGGPVRLTYDPAGSGSIVAGSAVPLGGLNTVGFFADAGGNFKASSVALGPCDHSPNSTLAASCLALYVGFERSQKIERINNVDQPAAAQSIETISKTTDKRKGVRYGIGAFKNADGTTDIYIDELGGNGVSMLHDVANCAPSEGSPVAGVVNPPQNALGGCAATVIGAMTTSFPQGIAVQTDPATGLGKYIYYADSPRNAGATVLRYDPATGLQDIVSNAVTPYDSALNPGQTVSTYTFVIGLGVDNDTGDVYVGDDPTVGILVNPPPAMGHIFKLDGGTAHKVAADCVSTPTSTCAVPAPPSVQTPSLYAYGLTAPKGGTTFVPSDDGGHLWAADHSQGLCRLDTVSLAPGLHAFEPASCDDGTVLGSGGQTAYDDSIVPGSTNLHYLYVAQNDHLSPGVIRFTFDPSGDSGAGALVAGSAVVMAPNAGLNGDKANGLALGPCVKDAAGNLKFPTCKHALYMGGLLDGFIRRINNPEDAPNVQSVDVVAMTTEQRVGTVGKGINGSMGMIGDDLYLPENQGFTVVKNISGCPQLVGGTTQVCPTIPLNISTFGLIFGSAIGVDPDPLHLRSAAGLVYAAISPGTANATLYQYDVATNTARIYATQGKMPAAGTAEATVYCTTTCTRPVDPNNPPGGLANFRFAQGIMVDPDPTSGTVYMTEDAFAGARGGRGHAWVVPGVFYPTAGVTPVPLPIPAPATGNTCALTISVPALPSGQTYWLQVTTHGSGQISASWKLNVAQSAKLLLYPGNPFAGLADPVSKGSVGGSIASQTSSNTANFSISTAPTSETAGTYTLQFFNGAGSLPATTGTINYANGTTACPASPAAGAKTVG